MPYKTPEITKEKSKEYYEKNKERIKQKTREYRDNNKEKLKEKKKEYVEKNQDKIKEWVKNNRDRINENRKKWYEKNRDKMTEYMRQWMKNNYQEYRLRRDAYETANKEKLEDYRKDYYEKNRPIKLEYSKRRFRYKDKYVVVKENPRSGKCFFCEREDRQTNIHHYKYDDNNPLDFTIELCVSCHRKWHSIMPTPEGYINPNHKNKK